MSCARNELLLAALKVDLGITTDAFDARLQSRLDSARERIAAAGVTLDLDVAADRDLVVMYAAWLWSERRSGTEMPRMLAYTLHSRLYGQKARG